MCVILCIFVFLCDILQPSGVINDEKHVFQTVRFVIIVDVLCRVNTTRSAEDRAHEITT